MKILKRRGIASTEKRKILISRSPPETSFEFECVSPHLSRLEPLPLVLEGGEGRARGEDCPPVRVRVGLLGRALRLARGVAQGEDDGLRKKSMYL